MKTRVVTVLAGAATVLALAGAAPAHATNFVVDSTLDVNDGLPNNGCEAPGPDECTMREAILAANASAGTDGILFGVPDGSIINVGTALPPITQRTDIGNGFGFIKVELNGPGPSAGATAGLEFTAGASDSTLSIVSIVDFDRGVVLNGADRVTIESTRIGLTAAGTVAGNGSDLTEGGIHLIGDADSNTIGTGNIIAANAGDGIEVGSSADNTTISGSTIGTDGSGSTTLGNGGNGVDVGGGSGTAITGGVIGNNGLNGIVTTGPATTIKSALIGTNGSSDLGNTGDGIRVSGPTGVATIGGTGASDGNTIAGNGGNGVSLESSAGGSVLQGNAIGIEDNGNASSAFRNGGGVFVTNSPNNRIGTPGAGNRISNNSNEGVRILNPASDGNRVEANLVGLDSASTGNVLDGIRVGNDADATVIGSPGAGNVIGNNGTNGIRVDDTTTSGTIVQANLVGVDTNGTTPRGNDSDGIAVNNATATVVGGLGAGEGNVSSGTLLTGSTFATGPTTPSSAATASARTAPGRSGSPTCGGCASRATA